VDYARLLTRFYEKFAEVRPGQHLGNSFCIYACSCALIHILYLGPVNVLPGDGLQRHYGRGDGSCFVP
jgi:hypothetical protein